MYIYIYIIYIIYICTYTYIYTLIYLYTFISMILWLCCFYFYFFARIYNTYWNIYIYILLHIDPYCNIYYNIVHIIQCLLLSATYNMYVCWYIYIHMFNDVPHVSKRSVSQKLLKSHFCSWNFRNKLTKSLSYPSRCIQM